LQGNTAAGIRSYGVIIDQVRLIIKWGGNAFVKLIAHQELSSTLKTPIMVSPRNMGPNPPKSLIFTNSAQGVNFVPPANSTLKVNSGAKKVKVNCRTGSCTGNLIRSLSMIFARFLCYSSVIQLLCAGTWDWSYLQVSGGTAGMCLKFIEFHSHFTQYSIG
jgi:hypothetical protein